MSVQINVQASQSALAQSIAQGVAAFNSRYAGQNQLNLQINARAFSQPLGRITSDLADFESALKASNARVLAFGASTAVLGGVVRSFKEIANVTIEVEKSLTDINRVLNLSTNNLQKFSSELFSISKQTASSFDDATKAALEFSRQGLNTEETLKRTADALTLVRLTGISSTKAVEDLTATINGFAKAGLTTSQVVNKLAAVEQDFAVSATDLTEALSRTGQAAQEAGVSFDELNALVTTAQQNTARGGAVIGNALKTIFTRLQRTETLDQLENFNIAVRDVQGNILPAVQILKNFADQYNNLADAQRAQLSEQVAGVYQVNILKGVIKDLNNSQGTYVQALERGAMAANEADIANEKLNKTLSALVTQTGVGLQQLANNVGKVTFAPIFEAIVSPVNDAVSYINDTLEGEGIGSIFANGLLKGVRNVIAGPGLAVAFAVIAKVAKNTFEDATKALPAILGLTTEAQKRANIEKSIISILQTQSNLSLALQGQQGNLSSQAATVLNYARLQTAQYQQQLQIAQQLAPLLAAQNVTVGSRGIQVGPKIKAGGHIPAFAEMSERMGAAMGGYKSGKVVKAPKSVGANTYMNSAEEVKYVSGFAQPFINPPANSKAGRKHRQNAINRIGVDPYMANGFIPNFAEMNKKFVTEKINIKDGDTISGYPVEPLAIDYRLAEVDAVESNQKFNEEAINLLRSRGYDKAEKLNQQISDKAKAAYYRGVFSDKSLAKDLINNGYAVPDLRYTKDFDLINLAKQNYNEYWKTNGNPQGLWKYLVHPKNKQFQYQAKLLGIDLGIMSRDSIVSEADVNKKGIKYKKTSPEGEKVFGTKYNKLYKQLRFEGTYEDFRGNYNSGFIPNFAPPTSAIRIPWFKKFGNASFDAIQPTLGISNASDTDTFRSKQFRSKAFDKAATDGDPNLFAPLYEDFVFKAMQLVLQPDIKDELIRGYLLEPGSDRKVAAFDAGLKKLGIGLEYKGYPKGNLTGTIGGELKRKYETLSKNSPDEAAKLKELIIVFNEIAHENQLPSEMGKSLFGSLAGTSYSQMAKNNPDLVKGLSAETNMLLERYVKDPNFLRMNAAGGFIPNFADFIETEIDAILQPISKSRTIQSKQLFGKTLDSAAIRYLNDTSIEKLNKYLEFDGYMEGALGIDFPDRADKKFLFTKNKGFIPNFSQLMKGYAFNDGRIYNDVYHSDAWDSIEGPRTGAIKYANYNGKLVYQAKNISEKLKQAFISRGASVSSFLPVQDVDAALRSGNTKEIQDKSNQLGAVQLSEGIKAIYENGRYTTFIKDNKSLRILGGITPDELKMYGGVDRFLAYRERVHGVQKWQSFANGFIPNFAYKQSVMALEEGMSGNKAIFDTKPFPHIRNSSQPTFSSAISDHGGLKNALSDSMRNQEAVGLMSKGFVPNFATVNAQAGFGLPFGALKASEQKLFVEMNKALSQLTRDLTLTSQQQNTLRQTILNNANALQASTGSTNIVTEANNALATSLQQNANAQQKAAAIAAQQQAAQQPVQQTLSTRLLGTSRGGKFDKIFNKLSNNIGFNLAAPLLGGVAESLIAGGDDRSEMGYGRRLASSGASAALSGLSTGAAIGSAIPGIGTAAGAAIGALVGFGGAALNAKNSLEDLQKVSEKYRNETQTAVESGKGIINIVKSLGNLDPNSLEAFDANQKLQDYFVKLADTGLDSKFREAGNDIESMIKAIKDYETERATQAKRNSENEKRMLNESLSIEDIRKKDILKVEDIIEKRTYRKFKPTEEQKRIYGPNVNEGMVPLGLAQFENATYDVNMGQRIVGTGTVGDVNFQSVIKQYPQLFDDLRKVQDKLGTGFKKFSEILKDEGDDLVFNQGKLSDILKENPIEGIDPDQLADTLQTVAKDSGLQGKFIIEYFDQIMEGLASGKFKTAAEAAAELKNKIVARQESIRDKLFKYSQAIEQSISSIGIQIENYEFEKNFGKLNLEKSAQIINEGLSAISKNIDSAFKNQFDFLVDQTSNLQQKRLLDFEAQNFQKDLSAQAESRRLGRAKELVSVLQTALGETAGDQIGALIDKFRSTGKVDIGSISEKDFADGAKSKRAIEAFNLTTRLSDEEAKNKEDNARKIFMLEQTYANQSLKLKNETGKLDYDLSERRYKNAVREKELIDSISNQSKQIQIRGQAQIERSRIEADSPYFMLGQSEFTIADEKRRREAAATQSGFELEARQAIADAEIARIQREVLADNTNATLQNTTAIEALIMSMTAQGNKEFLQQNETLKAIDEQIKIQESFSTAESTYGITSNSELQNLRAKREAIVSSSNYAANKASSEIYNRQMENQIARQTLAERKVQGGAFAAIDLSTINDPIKYLDERASKEKVVLKSLESQKNILKIMGEDRALTTEESAKLKALDEQIAQQRKVVNEVDTANLAIKMKITNEDKKQYQYNKDALKRGTFTTGVAKAVGTIRSETEMFKETLGTTTVNAFRDGLVGAMDAALNKADDLESALMGVAAGFLREIQGVMLRNIANQLVGSVMPNFGAPATGNQRGGIIRAQSGMYISGGRTGDKNPALLEDGEYVLNRNAVKALGGPRAIDQLNFNAFPRFATGGDPGTMSASVSMSEPFERLSMYGREQSPEYQSYLERLREEEAAREKKRAERKALLNQFIGTLISTGISMGLSSAVGAAKEASMAKANLKGATGTLSNGTTTQVTSFADAKNLINSGGSVTLANGSTLTQANFADGFSRGAFNQIAAARFAESGIKINPGGLFRRSSATLMGKDYANKTINERFANPAAAFGRSQSIYEFSPYKGKQKGGIVGFNQGGFLPYGSRLTDSIPAYLTGGEYVINSRAVRKYGVGGLNRINSGVARFQDGGMVGDSMSPSSNSSNTSNSNISINITVNANNGKVGDQESDSTGDNTESNSKELSNRIKAVVLDVITTEQRSGGLLDSTKKK